MAAKRYHVGLCACVQIQENNELLVKFRDNITTIING